MSTLFTESDELIAGVSRMFSFRYEEFCAFDPAALEQWRFLDSHYDCVLKANRNTTRFGLFFLLRDHWCVVFIDKTRQNVVIMDPHQITSTEDELEVLAKQFISQVIWDTEEVHRQLSECWYIFRPNKFEKIIGSSALVCLA